MPKLGANNQDALLTRQLLSSLASGSLGFVEVSLLLDKSNKQKH
jgi:hypothetical protein